MDITDPQIAPIIDALRTVEDPELGIDVYELGLIYDVRVENQAAHITFSLTQRACPMRRLIEQNIKDAVSQVANIETVATTLTFEPTWEPARMTEDAKVIFGLLPAQMQRFVAPNRFANMKTIQVC